MTMIDAKFDHRHAKGKHNSKICAHVKTGVIITIAAHRRLADSCLPTWLTLGVKVWQWQQLCKGTNLATPSATPSKRSWMERARTTRNPRAVATIPSSDPASATSPWLCPCPAQFVLFGPLQLPLLTPWLLFIFERSALDKEEVEGLLQHVDHEKAGQHQDLSHRQPRVGEIARF